MLSVFGLLLRGACFRRHVPAARHAELALGSLLDKMGVPDDISPDDIPEEQKELAGLLAVAFYNLGVEQEALDRPEEGLRVGQALC